jgi:hypothetical protein
LTLTIENRGVAPPYQPYALRVKLSGAEGIWTHTIGQADRTWLPGAPVVLRAELPLPATLRPGRYDVAIGLFDSKSNAERPVEFALKGDLRDPEGFYRVTAVSVSKAP